MRKIFLFWIFILIALIIGTVAIVYGKLLLKEETKKAEEIRSALVSPGPLWKPELPAPPPEKEKETAAEIELTKPAETVPSSEVESNIEPESTELPKSSEPEAVPSEKTKGVPEIPVLQEMLKPPDEEPQQVQPNNSEKEPQGNVE